MTKLNQDALEKAYAAVPPHERDKHFIATVVRAYVDAAAEPPADDEKTDWMGIHHGRNK